MMVIESYSIATISKHVGIDPTTLRKYYSAEIEHSKVNADVLMAQSIFLQGVGGPKRDWSKANFQAAKWYSQTKMGWKPPREEIDARISGPNGGPVQTITAEMSPKQAAELYARTIDNDEN